MATPAFPSDEALVRYVLGGLSEDDSAALDERSIVDAEFAARLRGVEHDLADAYARGELSAADREEWERRYLVSEHGREDERMAQALLARERRTAAPSGRAALTWGLAAAAALLITTVIAYFAVVHRSSPAPVSASIAPAAQKAAQPSASLRVAALTLAPMTRSVSEPPALQVPPGTDQVRLTLRLEPNDFQRYDVAIKDLSTNGIVWRVADVSATTVGGAQALIIAIPASTLEPHRYLVTASGVGRGGLEMIGTYPMRVVLE